ncbi:hypothetical protein BWQ96_01587 [Gracilariopsis chorda]|uniref:Uncharacterized protein n=1 Tax=Gracilariopsis chorda TaxID=448386 RepID=A0A2V3J2X4_9FLOR|nr:hypothetical protein BWQ96_01587 [Gracilariopsis chorda]|eukprot:PXF48735.1 hypothetical protein BWQ96_01587 [Gracilariopsis chorda]
MTSLYPGVNYSLPVQPSHAVGFFRSVPRWPSASDTFEFSFSYLSPVALTALLPIFFAAILTLYMLVHLVVRYSCRQSSTDARINRISKSKSATLVQCVFSSLCLFLIFTFTSLTLLANASLQFASHDALDLIAGLTNHLSLTGFSFVDVALFVQKRLGSFQPSEALSTNPLSDFLPEFGDRSLTAMHQYILQNYPNFNPLRQSLDTLVTAIGNVLVVVRRAVTLVYIILLTVILLIASGPLLLFLVDAFTLQNQRRIIRFFAHLCFIVLPVMFCWACVGVTAGVGVTLADVCVMLHDYRAVLLGNQSTAPNALLQSGFDCPVQSSTDVRERIQLTAGSILQSSLAVQTVQMLLNTSAESVAETALWSGTRVESALNCSMQIVVSGKLERVACSPAGHGAVQGVYELFVGFLGLAICLSVAGVASLFGMQVARSLIVWRGTRGIGEGRLNSGVDDAPHDAA